MPIHKTPTAFVSYSCGSNKDERWVLKLATDLLSNGVNVKLYNWDAPPGTDLTHFMEEGMRKADRVLVICTPLYVRKADRRCGGVGFETMLLTGELGLNIGSNKFIPIIRQGSGHRELPAALTSRVFLDFSDDRLYQQRLDELLRVLHGVAVAPRPPLGPNPFLDSEARRPRPTHRTKKEA